jgi:nucleoside-diphosphate-sugar epimerase
MPSTKRVLIAGCGDLGLRVAQLLAIENSTNCSWGLRRQPNLESTHDIPSFTWIAADLTQPDTLRDLPKDITHVLYTAAPNARTEADYRAVYREGLERLVLAVAAPSLQRVLFVSSTAVYGAHGAQWIDEDTPTAPKSFNGQVLLETEQWLYKQNAQFETLSLRLSGIYGPGRSYLLERLRTGQATAPMTESHWVNRIHIEDAAAAVVHLMNLPNPKPIYLVTDSTPLPMRVLYDALAKLVGGPTPPAGDAPASIGSKRLSNARLRDSGFTLKWPDSREGHAALMSEKN